MAQDIQAFDLYPPTVPAVPLVCDSPHSGTTYPADFGYCAPKALLRKGEDTDVDALWCLDASPDLATELETLSAINLKRTWIEATPAAAWADANWAAPDRFLHQATQVKNVWVPYGI